jgi:hypothetical protein
VCEFPATQFIIVFEFPATQNVTEASCVRSHQDMKPLYAVEYTAHVSELLLTCVGVRWPLVRAPDDR